MGKVIVLISTTPDGFADAQHVIIDPDFFEFTHSLMDRSKAIIFGRKTFEQFQERWPQRLADENSPPWVRKMAQSLHDIPKIVFSSTLKITTWNNSTIMPAIDPDYIASFKNDGDKGLMTFGSLSVVESLIALHMVDDYYFNLQPVIPGNGEGRFFSKKNLDKAVPLKYIDCTQMPSGAHIMHYQNAGITT